MTINVSIVLYMNEPSQIEKILGCVLKSEVVRKVYLIDNSPSDELAFFGKTDKRVVYNFVGKNIGFGAAHNIAFRYTIEDDVEYHVVLNPDIYFDDDPIFNLLNFMGENGDVSVSMPRVLYPNGEEQFLCKLLPTPLDFFIRRFIPFPSVVKKWNYRYEMRFKNYETHFDCPVISGCFMFIRVSALKSTGGFDERYFMYLEDVDLCRRLNETGRISYFPETFIVHEYQKGSYKNLKLMRYHLTSAIQYFHKWGFFFDKKRKEKNLIFIKQN